MESFPNIKLDSDFFLLLETPNSNFQFLTTLPTGENASIYPIMEFALMERSEGQAAFS